jgi:hypothetical protein
MNLEIFIHGYGDQGIGLLRMGINHFIVPITLTVSPILNTASVFYFKKKKKNQK